jgi:hypothetical protein
LGEIKAFLGDSGAFKGDVISLYNEVENQAKGEQAARIKEAQAAQSKDVQALASTHKGSMLHSFKKEMKGHLEKAGISTEEPTPDKPSSEKTRPR